MTVAGETARVGLKNILYLTDFSESSEAALPFAMPSRATTVQACMRYMF